MAILKGETAIDREVSRQEALKGIRLFGEIEKKRIREELEFIEAETIRTQKQIKVEKEKRIKVRKEKIRRVKRGLGRALIGLLQGGRRTAKKKAIRVVEIKIRMKKKSKIVGMFEKQQEEKSLFFK